MSREPRGRTLSFAHVTSALATALISGQCFATEGIAQHGYDAITKGRAGAGAAWGDHPSSIAINPALIAGAPARWELTGTVLNISRGYEANPGGNVAPGENRSSRDWFVIPGVGITKPISGTTTLGLAVYGNGGVNTTYQTSPGPFGGGKTGLDLLQLFIQPTVAYKVSDQLSLGVGGILVYQRFNAYGLGAFRPLSQSPSNVSDNGVDTSTGAGVRLGVQYKVSEGTSFGAGYQPSIRMSKFDKYSGLIAQQGRLDVPWSVQAGIAQKVGEQTRLYLDYREIGYGDLAAFKNPITNFSALGSDTSPGFGWRNVRTWKLGADYEVSSSLMLRAGVSINNNPAPPIQAAFVLIAPGHGRQHLSAGATYKMGSMNLDVALTRALKATHSGSNAFAPAQQIRTDVSATDLTIGLSAPF